jgi:hypothetical protein
LPLKGITRIAHQSERRPQTAARTRSPRASRERILWFVAGHREIAEALHSGGGQARRLIEHHLCRAHELARRPPP